MTASSQLVQCSIIQMDESFRYLERHTTLDVESLAGNRCCPDRLLARHSWSLLEPFRCVSESVISKSVIKGYSIDS
jgi:hypothetical protein